MQLLTNAFEMPADGWYQISSIGEFPHNPTGLVQIVDEDSCRAMAQHFLSLAGQPNFAGLLIDFDHFSLERDKPSEAAGWIVGLESRPSGLWAQIRWSDAGEQAVKGGRYRFISPVWRQDECEDLGNKRVRPRKLVNAAVTNDPNIRGMVPLSNRSPSNIRVPLRLPAVALAKAGPFAVPNRSAVAFARGVALGRGDIYIAPLANAGYRSDEQRRAMFARMRGQGPRSTHEDETTAPDPEHAQFYNLAPPAGTPTAATTIADGATTASAAVNTILAFAPIAKIPGVSRVLGALSAGAKSLLAKLLPKAAEGATQTTVDAARRTAAERVMKAAQQALDKETAARAAHSAAGRRVLETNFREPAYSLARASLDEAGAALQAAKSDSSAFLELARQLNKEGFAFVDDAASAASGVAAQSTAAGAKTAMQQTRAVAADASQTLQRATYRLQDTAPGDASYAAAKQGYEAAKAAYAVAQRQADEALSAYQRHLYGGSLGNRAAAVASLWNAGGYMSDEQRRAMFARLRGSGGGRSGGAASSGGANAPREPSPATPEVSGDSGTPGLPATTDYDADASEMSHVSLDSSSGASAPPPGLRDSETRIAALEQQRDALLAQLPPEPKKQDFSLVDTRKLERDLYAAGKSTNEVTAAVKAAEAQNIARKAALHRIKSDIKKAYPNDAAKQAAALQKYMAQLDKIHEKQLAAWQKVSLAIQKAVTNANLMIAEEKARSTESDWKANKKEADAQQTAAQKAESDRQRAAQKQIEADKAAARKLAEENEKKMAASSRPKTAKEQVSEMNAEMKRRQFYWQSLIRGEADTAKMLYPDANHDDNLKILAGLAPPSKSKANTAAYKKVLAELEKEQP